MFTLYFFHLDSDEKNRDPGGFCRHQHPPPATHKSNSQPALKTVIELAGVFKATHMADNEAHKRKRRTTLRKHSPVKEICGLALASWTLNWTSSAHIAMEFTACIVDAMNSIFVRASAGFPEQQLSLENHHYLLPRPSKTRNSLHL